MRKNVILTGMMGVGKSTVGRNLAKRLSFNFIDIDELIQIKEKTSINNIFKNKGETYFRRIEAKITQEEIRKKNSVISLGGGAFLNKMIRHNIKTSCVSFWLDVGIDKLVSRLKKSKKRPLLIKKNLSETVYKIYLKRKKTYNEADFRIKCNSSKPAEIVNKIYEIYESIRN